MSAFHSRGSPRMDKQRLRCATNRTDANASFMMMLVICFLTSIVTLEKIVLLGLCDQAGVQSHQVKMLQLRLQKYTNIQIYRNYKI